MKRLISPLIFTMILLCVPLSTMAESSLEGYVISRNDKAVTLDLGLPSGVEEGMKFIVFEEGEPLKHPKTGEILGVERNESGIVFVTKVFDKYSNAKIESETSQGAIKYGQAVESLATIIEEEPARSGLTMEEETAVSGSSFGPSPAAQHQEQFVENSIRTPLAVSRLFVNTNPTNARVRIMNITQPYQRGIALDPGPYHLKVSAQGYKTINEWITLEPQHDMTVSFELIAGYSQPPLAPRQAEFINMLRSGSNRLKTDAAKRIARERLSDPVVLNVVERELLNNYRRYSGSPSHIDAMSWFCKALGASRMTQYRHTLNKVANNAPNQKLRRYARESLNRLY